MKGHTTRHLLTRFRQRQNQGERKSDQQVCSGDLKDLAYDRIIELFERYDSSDIRDIMSSVYSANTRNRKGTVNFLHCRLRQAVKTVAGDQGVSHSDVIQKLNRKRHSFGLKPLLTNMAAASTRGRRSISYSVSPASSLQQLSHARHRAQLPSHQLKTCVDSRQRTGEALGTRKQGRTSSFLTLMATTERIPKVQQDQFNYTNNASNVSSINTIPEKIWDSKRRESTGYDNITDHVNELLFLRGADMLAKYHEYRSVYEEMYDTIAAKKSDDEIVSQEDMTRFERVIKLVEEMKDVCSYRQTA